MPLSRDTFTLGVIQMRMDSEKETNLRRAIEMIHRAGESGAAIVCLPELFLSLYFCQTEDATLFDLAEPIPGPSSRRLAQTAQDVGVVLVASLFEKRMPGVYHNTTVTFDVNGDEIGRYRKMHIPDDPLYYEKFYFTPGDLGFRSVQTGRANVGTLICWDQWYPEAARLTALKGAEVLFYPTAIGWHPREKEQFGDAQYQAWETMQRSHAIANGLYVAAVNRIGHEGRAGGGIEFWGGSFVCDPFGRILKRASHDQEEILIVECDRALIEEVRRNWPFFRDRRIDAYEGIGKRVAD